MVVRRSGPQDIHSLSSEIEPSRPSEPNSPAPWQGPHTGEATGAESLTAVEPDLFDQEEYPPGEYQELMQLYEETLTNIEEGQIVKGTIQAVSDTHVILDVGYKSEGTVPLEEFKAAGELKPGDQVDVYLESLEDKDGALVLSKKKADFLLVWDRIRESYEQGETVKGRLVRKIKGGVVVDLFGVDAFLPGSQIALRRVPNVDDLLEQVFEFKIIKLNKRRRNIVISRRIILEKEREERRAKLLQELQVGQVRKGVVKNITDFGAFIDLGGVDGLLHITDISWGRVNHPSEVLKIGNEVEVKVLDLDFERERISLGFKQLQPYPWEGVAKRYPGGTQVGGRVVSITNYGAFVELEPGVEGLVHISEMSWTRNVRHPSQLVSIGDRVEVVVLGVDEKEEKISLGMKQLEHDPLKDLVIKYPPGTRIRGKVRNLTSFGAFVEIEEGIDGLVHISDMSWTKRVMHPSEILKKGDEVEVVVLQIDVENRRISLGLKQVEEDPWEKLSECYPVGMESSGKIVRLLDKGLIVDLGDEVEGFVPISQLGIRNLKSPSEVFKVDESLLLRVIECDPENRRIVLGVVKQREGQGKGKRPSTEEAPAPSPGEESEG